MMKLKLLKMYTTSSLGLISLGCISVILLLGLSLQLATSNVTNAQTTNLLKFEISSPKRSYLQREPVPLRMAISNQTSEAIFFSGNLEFGANINLFMLVNGVEVRWNGASSVIDSPAVHNEVLQEGRNKEVQKLIKEDFVERLFPNPGRYEFRAEFTYSDLSLGEAERKTISSNSIIIQIEEPRGRDRLAYDFLKNVIGPATRLGSRNEEVQARRHFANNFRTSVYWPYNIFDLANIYLSQDQYEDAENEFYDISDVDFYFSDRVELELDGLAKRLRRATRRTKRMNTPVAMPFVVPMPTVSVTPGVPPPNIPPPVALPVPTR